MSCNEVSCYKCGKEFLVYGNYYCTNSPSCAEGCDCHNHRNCPAKYNPNYKNEKIRENRMTKLKYENDQLKKSIKIKTNQIKQLEKAIKTLIPDFELESVGSKSDSDSDSDSY
jgi:hypothetical protein